MSGIYNADMIFCYDGKIYGRRTKVKIRQSYLDMHTYDGCPIWPYASFDKTVVKDNRVYHIFTKTDGDYRGKWMKCAGYFTVDTDKLELMIEEITYANEVNVSDINVPRTKRDWEIEGMGAAWLAYLTVLTGSLVFNQFYFVWGAASYIFFKYRKEKLNQ